MKLFRAAKPRIFKPRFVAGTYIALRAVYILAPGRAVLDAVRTRACDSAAPVARIAASLFKVLGREQAARRAGENLDGHEAREREEDGRETHFAV